MNVLKVIAVEFLLIVHVVHGAISTECLDSYTNMTIDPNMNKALADILLQSLTFADIGGGAAAVTTVIDYSKAAGKTYNLLESRCADLVNHTLCTAATNVSTGTFYIQELEKPLCVPDSCSDEEIYLVDPEPVCGLSDGCFSSAEITSCSGDKVTAPTTCADDMINLETQFVRRPIRNARDRYYAVLEGNCVQSLFGQRTRGRCEITDSETGLKLDNFNVIKDYSKLDTLDMLEYSAECSSRNHKMCDLTTVASIGDVHYYEVAKPVCVPSSCSSESYEDFASLDPFPLCADCEIVSQSISCSDEDETSDVDQCLVDVNELLLESDFTSAYEATVSLVDESCFDALHGDNSGTCSLLTKTEAYVNVTGIDSTVHDTLIETCITSGIPTCLFTGTVSTVYRDIQQNAVETWYFSKFPVCIPSECEAENTEFLAEYLPSLNNVDSSVEIEQFVCEQTMAPSASMFPSLSPSGVDSASPSVLLSVSPTIAASQLPSLFTSSSPSEATLTPTIETSSVPSTTPVPDEPVSVSTNITSIAETIETVITETSDYYYEDSVTVDPPAPPQATSSAMLRITSLASTTTMLLVGVWAIV